MPRLQWSIEQYIQGIRAGDRVALGRAITLIESTRPDHQRLAQQLLQQLSAEKPNHQTLRIAVTGAPGVGKSSFIEALGLHLVAQNLRIAVLAIDPSSAVSGGSILGDKTRMERLSMSENVFIRPSPSGGSLGGVARSTRETIHLVEAAGYPIVLIETVGVGQSEIAVRHITDIFLLLLLPGAGDELQGIKRGIVEMADLLIVNKADGERLALAHQAQTYYRNAVRLLPPHPSGWAPRVLACSSAEGTGIPEVWTSIQECVQQFQATHYFAAQRQQQALYWLRETIEETLRRGFYHHPCVQKVLPSLEAEVAAGRISPFDAAEQVLTKYYAEAGLQRN
ncbi:MAG: methylmalonyl Co-A mutase-associated GTPase MeaB [Saprospiraceae bacterium]|nr:methylmalonyl Co-A mutase-associated GTPase MeaB [Saprospiraceae bacterium]MDW8483604.1 methylmalonyl Co-A mutase-associated GTPase MeaB [Saprospiraceae bacterium]